MRQLGEEGSIQVFKPEVGSPMPQGAVGQLQFKEMQHRLKTEYDCDMRLAQERFPRIHFHPLREHAGLALQSAG